MTMVRIDDSVHEKMKSLAIQNNMAIKDLYHEAVDFYIKGKTQEILLADSKLETYINERIGRTEDRLASMLARNGMDTSIVLKGLLYLMSKLIKVDQEKLYEILRKEASAYFSKPYKEQRKEKE